MNLQDGMYKRALWVMNSVFACLRAAAIEVGDLTQLQGTEAQSTGVRMALPPASVP